jgi:peptide deformylase
MLKPTKVILMKLNLAYYPDPILRQKAEQINHIDDALRQLVSDMLETMHATQGIGLAAPQVFHSITLFVACVPIQSDGKWHQGINRVFINPQLISCSTETRQSEEGCLSIPGIYMKIPRPQSVHIRAIDMMGEAFEETMEGLQAANFLHEYDHLQGTLILDHLTKEEREKLGPQLQNIQIPS